MGLGSMRNILSLLFFDAVFNSLENQKVFGVDHCPLIIAWRHHF